MHTHVHVPFTTSDPLLIQHFYSFLLKKKKTIFFNTTLSLFLPSTTTPISLCLSYIPKAVTFLIHEENGDTRSFLNLSSNLPKNLLSSPPPLPLNTSYLLIYLLVWFFSFFMGAGSSSLALESEGGSGSSPLRPNLDDVPENCVSSIFMYLDPPEICKLAKLNKTFHGASLADFVWETKLPSNYKFLLNKALGQSPESLSKKEIYARLCQPNCFDDGTKQVWLYKSSGKICVAVSYKALRITGIDDRRYWNHISSEESRFNTIAYLQQIWWFEVVGELDFEFPAGTYSLFFRLQLGKTSKKFGRRTCNVDQVHGWDIKPVRFQLSTSNGQQASSECYLHPKGNWGHYHVGDFVVDNANTAMKLKFSMMQIDCTHTKGGVCLDSVFICPSEFREKLQQF